MSKHSFWENGKQKMWPPPSDPVPTGPIYQWINSSFSTTLILFNFSKVSLWNLPSHLRKIRQWTREDFWVIISFVNHQSHSQLRIPLIASYYKYNKINSSLDIYVHTLGIVFLPFWTLTLIDSTPRTKDIQLQDNTSILWVENRTPSALKAWGDKQEKHIFILSWRDIITTNFF